MRKLGRNWRSKRRKIHHTMNNMENDSSCDMDPNLIKLCQWMTHSNVLQKNGKINQNSVLNSGQKIFRNNCNLLNLKPTIFPCTGRGLRATKSIKKDDVIVSIPRHLMINCCDVMSDIFLCNCLTSTGESYSAIEILAAFILYHKSLGENTQWYPYINSLPVNFFFCKDDEIEFYPMFVKKLLLKLNSLLEESFKKLDRTFSNSSKCLSFTKEEILWAYMAVNTRIVFLDYKKGHCSVLKDGDSGSCALAPFLDLLNHSYDANISAYLDEKDNCYKIVSHVPYRKHDQVFINYGAHDNAFLFSEYGFILPKNPFDGYHVSNINIIGDIIKKYKNNEDSSSAIIDSRIKEVSHLEEIKTMYLIRDGPSWSLEAITNVLLMPSDKYINATTSIYEDINKSVLHTKVLCELINNVMKEIKDCYDRMVSKEDCTHHFKLGCELVKEMLGVVSDCLQNFQSDVNSNS